MSNMALFNVPLSMSIRGGTGKLYKGSVSLRTDTGRASSALSSLFCG